MENEIKNGEQIADATEEIVNACTGKEIAVGVGIGVAIVGGIFAICKGGRWVATKVKKIKEERAKDKDVVIESDINDIELVDEETE